MSNLKGLELARAYAEMKGVELGGKLGYDFVGRRVEIYASGLPAHPQWPHGRTWSMSARLTPTHCREYLANRGCMGQWVAYDPTTSKGTS